jgi:hypothetical protein
MTWRIASVSVIPPQASKRTRRRNSRATADACVRSATGMRPYSGSSRRMSAMAAGGSPGRACRARRRRIRGSSRPMRVTSCAVTAASGAAVVA